MQRIYEILGKLKTDGAPAEKESKPPADGIYCKACNSTGFIPAVQDGYEVVVTCNDCYNKRVSTRRLKKSVTSVERYLTYTFENFQTNTPAHRKMKEIAMRYVADYDGKKSFGVFGRSGTGKTHICVAICLQILEQKNKPFYYLDYRQEMARLKSQLGSFTEGELYGERLKELRTAENLYIDDLFKLSGTGEGMDRKELQIMFELINGRYLANKATLFSSEYSLAEITKIDEAVGSRIVEMCRPYLVKAEGANERITGL